MGEVTRDLMLSVLQSIFPQEQAGKLADLVFRLSEHEITPVEAERDLAALNLELPQGTAEKKMVRSGALVEIGPNTRLDKLSFSDVVGGHKIHIGPVTINVNVPARRGERVRRWRVYISHYAREAPTRQVLEEIQSWLTAAGFEILPDGERLKDEAPPWKSELFTWMGLANVGVVLISKEALNFPWIVNEMRILWARFMQHKFRSEKFFLIPVLLDNLQLADLQQLNLSLEEPGINPIFGVTPEQVAADVLNRLAAIRGSAAVEAALEELQRQVADSLKNAKLSVLIDVGDKFGHSFSQNISTEEARLWVAAALWHADLSTWQPAFKKLESEIALKKKIPHLVRAIIPNWVPPCASCILLDAARQNVARRVVLLMGRDAGFTGHSFVRRAFYLPPDSDWPVVVVNHLSDVNQDPVKGIQVEVKKKLLPDYRPEDEDPKNEKRNDDDLCELLQYEPRPVIVIIDDPPPDPILLNQICDAYSKYIFLIVMHDAQAGLELPGVFKSEPPLTVEENHATNFLKQMHFKPQDLKF